MTDLRSLFDWCEDNLSGFKRVICDESEHYYLNDVRIGGWAGDSQQYFIDNESYLNSVISDSGLIF